MFDRAHETVFPLRLRRETAFSTLCFPSPPSNVLQQPQRFVIGRRTGRCTQASQATHRLCRCERVLLVLWNSQRFRAVTNHGVTEGRRAVMLAQQRIDCLDAL